MNLIDVINDRALNIQRTRYFINPEKLIHLNCTALERPNVYLVKNVNKNSEYMVDMEAEVCSCPEGQTGKPCKHQCAVVRQFNLQSSQIRNFGQADIAMKKILFFIVYGPSAQLPPNWLAPLQGSEPEVLVSILLILLYCCSMNSILTCKCPFVCPGYCY